MFFMKNTKVSKEEMKDVKGGFCPEFSIGDSPEVGVQQIHVKNYCSEPLRTVNSCLEPNP
jgi:hypothetical protein